MQERLFRIQKLTARKCRRFELSLIQRIATRRLEDVIYQGYRFGLTGSIAQLTDSIIQAGATDRTIVITSFVLSSTSATDVLVNLGFKTGVNPTVIFFQSYVKSGAPVTLAYTLGDEKYSIPGDGLVMTTSASGPTSYTINGRIVGEKVSLGYIQIEGAGHSGAPGFPTEYSGFSSFWRGGFPG